ncbi:hypothetical protein NLI96_g11091 [Meripilus lineatus]|uniref:CFA20 domain-containing protein n=1 Tax=Meripilus lineatus TaxID=2056292 RepID=A0AAD5USD0_9APHY|nr:hypothetical protein NLI96_g11091 [Physisporinus lineatus]
MFLSALQPPIISLFSSTGDTPLALFSSSRDTALPADSFSCLLNDATSLPQPAEQCALISPPVLERVSDDAESTANSGTGYSLANTVLHIQSPTLRTTSLGREFSLEVGVVDKSGKEGIVRCSTFQNRPTLKLLNPPILHLPLAFPPSSSRPLTAWSTINLNLPTLLPNFSSASLVKDEDEDEVDNPNQGHSHIQAQVPGGIYSHVSYVKVYATCRLRRIWFTEVGPSQSLPWEFELYSSD